MAPLFPLYVVCDAQACERAGWTLRDFAAACLDGGARLLQVRAKAMDGARFLDAATAVVERARPAGALVVVNDRADIAMLAGAQGVHVGQDDLAPSAVRALMGLDALIGLSTHTELQQVAALREPVNYVAVGPVFDTSTKDTGYGALGVSGVRAAARRLSARMPLVAIGGITLDQAPAVMAAGAQSIAVITDLLATGNPTVRVRDYLRVLRQTAVAD